MSKFDDVKQSGEEYAKECDDQGYYCLKSDPPTLCVNIGTEESMENEYWCPFCSDFVIADSKNHPWKESQPNELAQST